MAAAAEVNAGATAVLRLVCKDEDGLDLTPSSLVYSIFVDESRDVIVLGESVTPESATVDIEIAPVLNAMTLAGAAVEHRTITYAYAWGEGKQGTGEVRYMLRRLGV